ncbi:MAG: hypothetical protein JXD23_07545 [Spirochaetales bacterium]|nr:hypothetical protein [Spirochaetales bacterium]
MTTKFAGGIGMCLYMFLVFLLIDSGAATVSGMIAAAAGRLTIIPHGHILFTLSLWANALLAVSTFAGLILFWTKRLFAKRLITILLIVLVAFRIFEVTLSFIPEVTRAAAVSVSILDTFLIKVLLGIVVPGLFLFYLFAPERGSDHLSDPRFGG